MGAYALSVTSPAASRPPELAHQPMSPIGLANCPDGGTRLAAKVSLLGSTWLRSPNSTVLLVPCVRSAMRTGEPVVAVCEPGPMAKKTPSLLANWGSYDRAPPLPP